MKKLKLTAVLALMGASTAWGQTDVTSQYLTNADFEKTAATTSNVSGNDDCRTVDNWSYEKTPAGNNKYYRAAVFSYGSTVKLNNQTPPTTGPASGKKCLGIQTPWGCTLKLYQAATLDPGRYTIKFYLYKKVNKDIGTNYFGFVEDAGTTHYGTTKSFSENAWQTETVTFDLVERTAGKVSLGYKSAGNGSSDNPHLFIDRVELIQELDGTALQREYLAAELVTARKWAGANVGTALFQRPVEAQNTLKAVIDEAQGVFDAGATEDEYKTIRTKLITALETYKNAKLNAPTEGQLINIINISSNYQYKGNAVTFKMSSTASVEPRVPTMGYNETPGSYLPQNIKFTATEENNTYTLSYTNYAGTTIYVTTQGTLNGTSKDHEFLRTTTEASKALKVKVIATDEVGVWNLYNTAMALNIGANSEKNDQGFFTKDLCANMSLTEAAKHEVQLTLTAEKPYSVLMLPYDAALPEGLKAYTVTTVNDRVLDLVETSTLTAMVPYVVYAEAGINHTFSGYGVAYNDGKFTEGLLTGVFTETDVPSGSYAFNYDKQGFFALAGGEKAAAHSAYFTLTGATAPGYYFNAADLLKLVKQNLKSDIDAAQAIATARVDVGTAAFQIPEASLNTLQGAINEANGVYSSETAAVDDVETANTTLNTAVTAYNAHSVLNAPKADEAFNLYLNDKFQKTVTFKDGNPGKGEYAIGYTDDAGAIYNQTVYCTAVADNPNTYYMYIKDAEGNKHYICTGAVYSGGTNKQIRMTTEEKNALPILVTLTSVPGIYNLKNTVDNNLIGSNGSEGFYTASDFKEFKITPAVKTSAQVVVTEAGYATIMLPFAAAVPDDVEAYTVDDVVGTTLTMNKVELLAANTPYVLKGAVTDVTLSGYGVAKKNTYEKGLLTGTYTAVNATADTYVLQNLEGKVAFYKVATGSEPTIGANRAYLTMPASAPEINALYFPTLGDETAAAEVKVADAVVDVLTINGVVVRKGVKASEALRGLKRGLYIVGGEKRVVNE